MKENEKDYHDGKIKNIRTHPEKPGWTRGVAYLGWKDGETWIDIPPGVGQMKPH